MAKEKKETKASRIVNYVIMGVEIIIIILCIIFSIMMITGQKTSTESLGSGTNITAVLSDSMDGEVDNYKIKSFKIGDLLIIKNIAGDAEAQAQLQEGDVLTYVGVGPTGEYGLISHRIYKIKEQEIDGKTVRLYYTLGDKQYTGHEEIDNYNSKEVQAGFIQGVVIGQVPKVGRAIMWLKDSTHFLLVVVIPLALLLLYNAYVLVRMVVDYKIKKMKEQNDLAVASLKADNSINEEEIKRKAIEEFLASQKAQNEVKDEPKPEQIETKEEASKEEKQ